MLKDDAPKYKVNYVRVYQNKQDERQKVGCSTPERPTRDYIEANLLDKFVVDGEVCMYGQTQLKLYARSFTFGLEWCVVSSSSKT